MNTSKKTISTKLEDFFLLFLRYTILFVLAISILLSCYFAVTGVLDLQAKPKSYSFQKFDSKDFIKELEIKPNNSENGTEVNNESNDIVKPLNKVNQSLKDEIAKQTKLVVEFYDKYGTKINQAFFTDYLLKQTNRLSIVYGNDDAGKLDYAKGQTEFFKDAFLNSEINKLVAEDIKLNGAIDPSTDKPRVNQIGEKILDFYPNFHENQLYEQKKFDEEQTTDAATSRAGAMFKLYVAGGAFGVFLLISLILILVKIERNLRFIRIEPKVEL